MNLRKRWLTFTVQSYLRSNAGTASAASHWGFLAPGGLLGWYCPLCPGISPSSHNGPIWTCTNPCRRTLMEVWIWCIYSHPILPIPPSLAWSAKANCCPISTLASPTPALDFSGLAGLPINAGTSWKAPAFCQCTWALHSLTNHFPDYTFHQHWPSIGLGH